MKQQTESKVWAELREIREKIYEEASAVGWRKYYTDLHQRAGFLFGVFPKRRVKRHGADTREPNAVKEVHEWRKQLRSEQEAAGKRHLVRERSAKYKAR